MSKLPVLIAMLVCCTPALVAGQAPADLVQAMRAGDQAIGKADLPTWEKLTGGAFTLVNETGHV